MAKGLSGTKLKSRKAQNIVEDILAISGDYGPEAVFCDWVEMMAIAIQNACSIHNATWESREQMYLRVMKKYPGLEERFSQMTALFVECMEECMDDYLGQIYMAAGAGNKHTGQFFTPFNLSELTASISVTTVADDDEPIRVNEPTCGAGGMIIATAKELQKQGVDWQNRMKVTCQDLSWNSVYMCYVQLSILGIDAVVAQGDTLTEPYREPWPAERVFRTPKHMGVLRSWT